MAFSPTTFDLIVWNVEHGLSCTIFTPEVSFYNGSNDISRKRLIQIDAGMNSDAGFSPLGYLYDLGYKEIDCLVVSHPDLDHIDDLPNMRQAVHTLIRNKTIPSHMISNDPTQEGAAKREFRRYHSTYTYEVAEPWKQLTSASYGGVSVHWNYLSHEDGMDPNDTSVVLSVEFGNMQVLFVGDLTSSSFDRMVAERTFPTPNNNAIRFLVAAHHGRESADPGNLLDYYVPSLVLASAKDDDDYTSTMYSGDKVTGYYVDNDLTQIRKFVSTKGSKGIQVSHSLTSRFPTVRTFSN